MNRLLKPDKLEVLPEDAQASNIFDYWLRTFEGFLQTVIANAEEVNKKENTMNKLSLLANFLTHRTFLFIVEATTYDEVKTALIGAYHKKKSEIFARHLLMTRKQQRGKSIAEYVHALRKLARDCSFTNVSAEQYREELMRDAFINGLTSSNIR